MRNAKGVEQIKRVEEREKTDSQIKSEGCKSHRSQKLPALSSPNWSSGTCSAGENNDCPYVPVPRHTPHRYPIPGIRQPNTARGPKAACATNRGAVRDVHERKGRSHIQTHCRQCMARSSQAGSQSCCVRTCSMPGTFVVVSCTSRRARRLQDSRGPVLSAPLQDSTGNKSKRGVSTTPPQHKIYLTKFISPSGQRQKGRQ